MTIFNRFIQYVSRNVAGKIAVSLYVLADTYFISKAVGANGITALNLVLPIYSVFFGLGDMIGVGSSIRFSQEKANGSKKYHIYFNNSIFFGCLFGLMFSIIGLLFPERILQFFGADATIVQTGRTYTRIFITLAPCFILNQICNSFVRNDGNPGIAMHATIWSSLFNIVFDYIFMFPMHMSMAGAALATGISPIIGILICCVHIFSKKSDLHLKRSIPSIKKFMHACQVGISCFIAEMSSGIITILFNFLILNIAGNIGVAAYGIIANIALVCMASLNGIALGIQPLVSKCFGLGQKEDISKLKKYGYLTSLLFSGIIVLVSYLFTDPMINIFNSEQNVELAKLAYVGIRIYFIGFIGVGINLVGGSILSSMSRAKEAFILSISRGFILICFFGILLSQLFGMSGIWASFVSCELVSMIYTLYQTRNE
ncbi:MAG: polysaccharide biosynthesis C-terminal domain-containing protein [Firmicutes bacterium]|nr:polysaccharide biosynthesis C-terminal domain-containing protein [Bacillota bacterium]